MGWVVNGTPRPLYPRKRYPVPILQVTGWAAGPVWTGAGNFASTGIRFPDRPARSESLTDCGISAPSSEGNNGQDRQGTEACLCNHCYSGKAISIAYSESVLVALVIQHAMSMRHIVICGLSGCTLLFHIFS